MPCSAGVTTSHCLSRGDGTKRVQPADWARASPSGHDQEGLPGLEQSREKSHTHKDSKEGHPAGDHGPVGRVQVPGPAQGPLRSFLVSSPLPLALAPVRAPSAAWTPCSLGRGAGLGDGADPNQLRSSPRPRLQRWLHAARLGGPGSWGPALQRVPEHRVWGGGSGCSTPRVDSGTQRGRQPAGRGPGVDQAAATQLRSAKVRTQEEAVAWRLLPSGGRGRRTSLIPGPAGHGWGRSAPRCPAGSCAGSPGQEGR